MPLIVITGGPCSGKSTLIDELARRGLPVVREAAIVRIEELNRVLGVEGQKAWRRGHRGEFQEGILELQDRLEAEALRAFGPDRPVYCDRGRFDTIAYCRFFGVDITARMRALMDPARYGRIFMLDTISDYERRAGTGRTSTRADSLRLRELIGEAYRERGLEPVFVPELPVEERADLVLKIHRI